jgi:SAM-dependent methyltransferase
MIAAHCYPAFGELSWSIGTGKPGFDKIHGAPIFDHLARHPDEGRCFDQAMTSIHGPETPAMIEAYGFARFQTIVDVGGGNGSTLIEILRSAPRARGIVFDLPGVVARAESTIRDAGLGDRCRVAGGSFFEAVPKDADAYVLRHIIHDWDDQKSIQILRRCREAMAPGGKVLVVESVIPTGDEPHPGKWLDIIMLAVPGGRERTRAEYEALLAAAGLRLERVVATRSPVSVVEAVAKP